MNLLPLPLQVWGGLESTVNRIGNRYYDQVERTGHALRLEDLDRFAALGIRALRYPLLWERVAPNGPSTADWRWADERLDRLRQLGIRPIAGLVHHGSGPHYTNLLDPAFPDLLARYARAVAERYPWLDAYTPVNEPLTTARFSALYGHWYPHARDERSFFRALVHQCRGVALAMRAIRQVNPAAQLIQTEDLGKVYSTPALEYQAEFENERRWLSLDLLAGRVTPDHSLWNYLMWTGITPHELAQFWENPCPPDIVGLNYYVTGERFLDEHVEAYPSEVCGGNGQHSYVDVEAVRVSTEGIAGPGALLREAWDRYRLPLAVTEAHIGCTREEQLRWFMDIWSDALALRTQGADVRAVTAWALLGSYDWDSLLTRHQGHYEPGVFDLRSPTPRPTALAGLLRDLSEYKQPSHPVLGSPGWWKRPSRLFYPAVRPANSAPAPERPIYIEAFGPARPIVITGGTGTLGRAMARLCDHRGIHHRLLTRAEMDIASPSDVERVLADLDPWAVVNAAGYVRVDDAEREAEQCWRENTEGPATLAEVCRERQIPLLTFSSDLVFDGTKSVPYVESDRPAPLNLYGKSKAEAERKVLARLPESLVIRTSAFFGPWDPFNFVTLALRALGRNESFPAANDLTISPTYVPDLVHASLDLLLDGERGLWHLANIGAITWDALARRAAERARLDPLGVYGRPVRDLAQGARYPAYSVLGSERGMLLPSLELALDRYFADTAHAAPSPAPMTGRGKRAEVPANV